MCSILMIDSSEPGRTLLQSRLPADIKIKFAPSLEMAWENLRKGKFDLILWDSSGDPSAQINFSFTLEAIATKIQGAKTIVFTDNDNVEKARSWGDHMQIEKLPRNDDDILRLIKNNLPAKSCVSHSRRGKD